MKFAESLDHFVVPVDDLVAAEEFYTRVFGGQIVRRNGLNVRHRQRGAVPHTFIQIGGKRMGVYLQSEERAKTDGAQGLPTYSFTTTPEGMNEVASELNKLGFSFEEPAKNSLPFANRALFFADPAGNHYAIYTSQTTLANSGTHSDRMSGVGYLELEAPELEASVRFYKQVLGFDFLAYSEHPILRSRRATMLMASDQTLILTESAFKPKGLVMSRSVPGPHIAFYIPATRWRDALAHLDELRIPTATEGLQRNGYRAETPAHTWMIPQAMSSSILRMEWNDRDVPKINGCCKSS